LPAKLVELHDLIVAKGGCRLLGPVSLTLNRGDFLGVVGPNGAGKSTLLRAICGLDKASEGQIRCGLRPESVALLFQQHGFVPDLPFSVFEIVLFGRMALRRTGFPFTRTDREAVEKALSALGLHDVKQRLYRELSGGERQKVQLARLLAQDAELLLLDEPTAGLDLEWQERLTKLTADIHRDCGKTVVMVTHDLDRLPACTNRVLLLRQGQALAWGAPSVILKSDTLSQLYGCPVDVKSQQGRYYVFSDSRSNYGGGIA
jgi:iron complex transport system ATP-binding protein